MSFCSWTSDEKYSQHFKVGIYVCSQCGNELFASRSKYRHDSPWPSFKETVRPDCLHKRPEDNQGLALKISCGKCRQGLGHEFVGDGPDGGSRF